MGGREGGRVEEREWKEEVAFLPVAFLQVWLPGREVSSKLCRSMLLEVLTGIPIHCYQSCPLSSPSLPSLQWWVCGR